MCIEPYEMPWLEAAPVTVRRERVEDVPTEVFSSLEAGDILFIDSSHMIRPQGDVVHEYLQILPVVKSGVFIHIHDIFLPREYPFEWLDVHGLLWNEQYLLEALLSGGTTYRMIGALNWLK